LYAPPGIAFYGGRNDYDAMSPRRFPLAVLLFLLAVPPLRAVAPVAPVDSLTHVLGAEYAAGGLRTLLLGAHWRDAWTTPFTVPVLPLASPSQPWIVLREAGGVHTRKLHLRDAEGRRWLFRAINLDPANVWRPDLRKAIVTRAMQDQVTTQLPFAPVVAASLERRAGLDVAQPRIVALPDSPLLGPFRDRFAGLVGTLAPEVPDDTADADGVYRNVVSTYAMLDDLERHAESHVDARAFARARLMDILLGDWDRDAEQWRWRRRSDGGRTTWLPLPDDRDQAFSLFDGVIPSIVERVLRPLQGYDSDNPRIIHLTWTGRHLDRRLLSALPPQTWDSLATDILHRLDDDALAEAASLLPATWQESVAPRLLALITRRRAQLRGLAGAYARLLSRTVDVHGSMDSERFAVLRDTDGSVRLTVSAQGTGVLFERRFWPENTDEIRIYAHGGADTVVVTGECDHSIDVRAVGGRGQDVLVDSSFVHGWFLDFTPIPRAEYCTFFYDDDEKTEYVLGPGATFDGRATRPPETRADRYEPLTEDRGYRLRLNPRLTYNSDDGFIIGTGPELTRYGFRQQPFSWRMAGSAAWASASGKPQLQFDGQYQSIFPDILLHLTLFHSELSFGRFYGFGNDSERDDDLDDADFYQVGQELVTLHAALRYAATAALTAEMGAAYRYAEVEAEAGSYLAAHPQYGTGGFRYAEIFGILAYDTREHPRLPMRGVYASLRGSYHPVMLDNRRQFADGCVDLRAYLAIHDGLTLAVRTRVQKIWGRYPFYHAATLGGAALLRGFNRERFAGDASALGSAELRLRVSDIRLIFPGSWGVLAFTDAGRVFLAGERSQTLHMSFGTGIWGGFADRRLTFSAQAALSPERLALSISTGFAF
jgi:hypothetical protein